MEYTVFNTDTGWIAIIGSERGLVSIRLPFNSAQAALESVEAFTEYATQSSSRFKDLSARLKAYFSGYRVPFPDKLDLSAASRFQKQVWQTTRLIPYGETRSYGWLAEKTGKPGAARAVGQALGKNRLPIVIPCHRVIGSDGSLGGFSGGLDIKKNLIRLEGGVNSL